MKNEKFNDLSKQARNREKDRSVFVEAVTNSRIKEMDVVFDEDAEKDFRTQLESARIFLLGETHGVRENPELIYTLFKKFGFRNLALEWEVSLRNKVEQFLETGEVDFDSIKDSPDGRITAGHFALIKKLREEGLLDKLICFDQSIVDGGWSERDAGMAKNILASLSESPTLVVAGNLHTKTEPIIFEDETEESHPMGEDIKRQIPNVPSGRINYLSGEFHNYGTKKFRNKIDGQEPGSPRFYKSDEGLYILELPKAHIAVVPDPSESLD